MKAFIKAISYFTPKHIVTNADLVRDFPDWSEKKISSKIGINQRYVADELTAGDMAECAAINLFNEWNIERNQIDAIILCTQSPDYFLPTTACILQDKLKLSTDVAAFDFNLGCSGFVYGLAIAQGMIASGLSSNILLLTAETYSKYIHSNDRGNRTLFSDAAAATLVSTNGFAEIAKFVLGTNGSGASNLIVENGAHRNRYKNFHNASDNMDINYDPNYLFMNAPEIFNFTLESVPLLVNNTLIKNNCSIDQIDLYVFHQANKHMLLFLRDAIGIPEDKFYICLENFGNTVSSTIPIALKEAIKDRKISHNYQVLIAGFGVGYSWGSVILHFKLE